MNSEAKCASAPCDFCGRSRRVHFADERAVRGVPRVFTRPALRRTALYADDAAGLRVLYPAARCIRRSGARLLHVLKSYLHPAIFVHRRACLAILHILHHRAARRARRRYRSARVWLPQKAGSGALCRKRIIRLASAQLVGVALFLCSFMTYSHAPENIDIFLSCVYNGLGAEIRKGRISAVKKKKKEKNTC